MGVVVAGSRNDDEMMTMAVKLMMMMLKMVMSIGRTAAVTLS